MWQLDTNNAVAILNTWSQTWTELIVGVLWQSTVLVLVVALLSWAFLRSSPGLRFWLYQIVALKLLLMPFWTWVVPLPFAQEISVISVNDESRIGAGQDGFMTTGTPPAGPSSAVEEFPSHARGIAMRSITWRSWLLLGWIALVFVQMAGLAVRRIRLARLLQRATAANADVTRIVEQAANQLGLGWRPAVLCTDEEGSPFVCGLARVVLVLPRSLLGSLGATKLRQVLLHELAHVKRRDLIWSWPPEIMRMVYFFHPVAQWLSYRIRLERELACDQLAMAASGTPASEYAATLVQVVSHLSQPAVLKAAAAHGGPRLNTFWHRRISMLSAIEQARPSRRRSSMFLMLAACAAICLLPTLRVGGQAPEDSIDNDEAPKSAAGVVRQATDATGLVIDTEIQADSLPWVRRHRAVAIVIDASPGHYYRGKIRGIPKLSDGTKSTGKIVVELLDPDDRLAPGMSAIILFRGNDKMLPAHQSAQEQRLKAEAETTEAQMHEQIAAAEQEVVAHRRQVDRLKEEFRAAQIDADAARKEAADAREALLATRKQLDMLQQTADEARVQAELNEKRARTAEAQAARAARNAGAAAERESKPEFNVFQLKTRSASELASALQKLFSEKEGATDVKIEADDRTNRILVFGSREQVQLTKAIIELLETK